MDKIKLSDGREYDVVFFGIASAGMMFIEVEMTFAEAAVAFASGTDAILYTPEDGTPKMLRGWTKLAFIANDEGRVRVALERPLDIEEVNNG